MLKVKMQHLLNWLAVIIVQFLVYHLMSRKMNMMLCQQMHMARDHSVDGG